MPPARVVAVAPGSPAARAGLDAGDEVVSVNGDDLRDVISYQMHVDGPHIELEVRRGGLERSIVVDKPEGTPLGAELESPVFDRVRTCDNHCPFCFIYQLPKGMRKSLYLKDDDYRLSFLYGNFTTLTRFTEADMERVITERLGPLYVSIHATDPDVRTRLLRWLALLLESGVEVHGQIVVCPGINDGAVLDDTLLGVIDRFPKLATIGVVPLGVSGHNREPEMRPHTRDEAAADLDVVERWQARFEAALGHRLVYASDEYYLLAGRELPALDAYDGCAQHENGIGMARTFEAEVRAALRGDDVAPTGVRSGFFAWVEGAPADGYRAPRAGPSDPRGPAEGPITILTGTLGAKVLAPLVPALPGHVRVLAVENTFFGGNIGVTGLLTGADLQRALADAPAGRYLLPDVALSRGRFLDGTTLDDLPVAVEVVETDGAALVAALSRS
jgi:putative radical SAM enzyme (TIGR03279 family)